MIPLRGAPPPEVARPLTSVLAQATAAGAPEAAWVAVEDRAGRWLREAAAAPVTERARAVVAASSEQALALAVRLGIGGALWLPPSTVSATAALTAAAGGSARAYDPALAELAVSGGGLVLVVTWTAGAFWRRQLGEALMAARLADLAEELEEMPAVLPWPALVVADRPEAEIRAAWDRLSARLGVRSSGVQVVRCEPKDGDVSVAATVLRLLVERTGPAVAPGPESTPLWPIRGLPGGRLVGWWSSGAPRQPPAEGWCAVPELEGERGLRWRLQGTTGEGMTVEEALTSRAISRPAVRVPGWVGVAIGSGRPAGLLVERLAAAAGRAGTRLWVPNVDHDALQLLLRLPGAFWVDGPAVPDTP